MVPVEKVGTMSVPWSRLVTAGVQPRARDRVAQAGQAMAQHVTWDSWGTFSRSIRVSRAAVPPPME
jgi:hypothetical protein